MDTTILLVDDDARILQTFARTLKLAGYSVITAQNGEEGLGLYHQEQPDIVLLDLRMPGMGGLEVLQAVRQHDPEANVILCTGHGDQGDVIAALRAGAADLLVKPVDPSALESALRRAEERIQLKRKLRASQRALRRQNERLEEEVKARTAELEREIEERRRAHAALKESEERLQKVINSQRDAIFILSAQVPALIVDCNPAATRMFDYSRDEMLGRQTTFLHVDEDALHQFQARLFSAIAEHGYLHLPEFQMRRKDGSVFFTAHSVMALEDERGERTGWVSVVRDISERKEAESALRESQQRMELALRGADLGTWDWNVATGEVVFNERWAEMLGHTLDEIEPHVDTWAQLVHPDDLPDVMEALNAHLEGKTDIYKTTHRARHKSGEWIWILDTGRVIERDADGAPLRACGTHLDITERVQAEQALRESEERYRLLAETTRDIIALHDMDARITYVNQAGLEFAGFEPSEAIGQPITTFIPAEYQADLEVRRAQRAGGDRQSYRYETEFVNRSGKRIQVEVDSTPVLRDGRVSEILLVARDISERVQAEKALRESEEKYRALFNQSASGIQLHDFEGRMLDVNEMACMQLGYSREELLELTLFDIHSDEEGTINLPKVEILRLWGLWQPGDRFTIEAEHRRKDGTMIPVEVSTGVIRYGDKEHILAIVQDITERKEAEAARERLTTQVHSQARHLKQILATVPEGVLLLDPAGRVMLANPVAEKALITLTGQDVGSLHEEPITHLGDHTLAELLTSPTVKGLWHEVKSEGRTFEVIARPMENGHESEDWVLLLRDVTREREIQRHSQQQERLAAVGQLAAGIAHDFNNIIAVIVLYTQMALSTPEVPPQTHRRLETVAQQAKQAAALIEQILDFSRRAVLERRPMDLTPFLKEVVKLLERTVPENIKIEVAYGADEYTVSADPTRMQQAIVNLVVNARDSMPEGGTLRVALSRAAPADGIRCVGCGRVLQGEWVSIAVTDTGGGIPPDVLPHIFEPFFTTKATGQGAGLGLAQVYGLVKQHEGHIDVTTTVGEGSTFTIYLPALLAHQPVPPVVKPQAVVKGLGETILVVEDNATVRKALVESVESLNYHILEAVNGRQALDVLEQRAEEISLVLSDLVMPEMGGQALFYAMREQGLDLPLVMLSGHPMEDELEKMVAQGLTGWMLKPPDMGRLSRLLAKVLRESTKSKEQ